MKVQQNKKQKKIIRYMKNVMEMCGVKMPKNKNNANVKVSATDKYFTLRDGITSNVICKIAKGEGFKLEYDADANTTEIYLTGDSRCECGEFGTIYERKINISEPDFVIKGNVDEVIFDFLDQNRKVEFVMASCDLMKGNYFWYTDTCDVYCGK
jgi:hypothetical protein